MNTDIYRHIQRRYNMSIDINKRTQS